MNDMMNMMGSMSFGIGNVLLLIVLILIVSLS
jgi:hypothetical protein